MLEYGTYIAFEGVVGCGKTTQSKILVEKLKDKYPDREVVWTREPGGSEIADQIRQVVQVMQFTEEMTPLCEQYLYAASRAQTLPTIVGPALERNAIVISDRSFWASVAFQGFGRGLGYETVMKINDVAVGDLKPDRVLYLDLDLEIAMDRARDKMGDKFEKMGKDFFENCRNGYKYMSERWSNYFLTVDAYGTVEQVQDRVSQALLGFI